MPKPAPFNIELLTRHFRQGAGHYHRLSQLLLMTVLDASVFQWFRRGGRSLQPGCGHQLTYFNRRFGGGAGVAFYVFGNWTLERV
jgi:hypothetical protein